MRILFCRNLVPHISLLHIPFHQNTNPIRIHRPKFYFASAGNYRVHSRPIPQNPPVLLLLKLLTITELEIVAQITSSEESNTYVLFLCQPRT